MKMRVSQQKGGSMEVEIMNIAEINNETKEQGFVVPKFTSEESGVYRDYLPILFCRTR